MLKRLKDDPLAQLEHVDILQRLGLSYHFEEEINSMLEEICKNKSKRNSLYYTALEFRLLQQHGYWVPQEVFNAFRDERGNFSAGTSDNNIIAMLSLYEASFHSIEGEGPLEEARDFTTKFLEEYVKSNRDQNGILSLLVSHALELPLHWRMPRLETRWFTDVYEKRQEMNLSLLELAKLDFNIVQATHQEDLKHVSRWWSETGLGQKLDFARDRLMENFMWTVGIAFEPQFGKFRRVSTKVYALITVIDNIFDVYGTLDELELFADAVESGQIFVNLIDWKQSGTSADIHQTCKEYFENAWIKVTAPVMLLPAYFFISNPITKEVLDCLELEYPSILRHSSMLVRLADDLGTSSTVTQPSCNSASWKIPRRLYNHRVIPILHDGSPENRRVMFGSLENRRVI
ncbi:hypothetical protein TIFTF001_033115 [Ficus carica]|uniref:Uncharacterized protein n=1 Tax=Ficus carica TaxID=3494 RepID=A0AA88J7A5_FICCA|nr:hypothetical protein TIFTF001_033115 [Ficus carica]